MPEDAEMVGEGGDGEHHQHGPHRALAQTGDQAPVVAVRHDADQKRQHEHRQELREADETERQWTFRQRIDLPADRDALHLVRDHGRDPGAEEPGKGPVLKEVR